MSMEVLIAREKPELVSAIATTLYMIWPDCEVSTALTGEEALRAFRERPAKLVVLDVELPEPDGFRVCGEIRSDSTVPIFVVSARTGTPDKVRAFGAGADDYLTEPLDTLELLARLRALARRAALPTYAAGVKVQGPSPRDTYETAGSRLPIMSERGANRARTQNP